jgi:hypothetical protein
MTGEQGESAVEPRRGIVPSRREGAAVILYIILAILFVAGLFAYVRVRGKRFSR